MTTGSVPRRGAPPEAALCRLRHKEDVAVEATALVALYADLGEPAAEAVIARALDDLARRLGRAQDQAAAGDFAAVRHSARLLARVGEQIGMTSFARIAGDVGRAAAAADATALGATLARLVRTGDRSMTAVWDMQDMSG